MSVWKTQRDLAYRLGIVEGRTHFLNLVVTILLTILFAFVLYALERAQRELEDLRRDVEVLERRSPQIEPTAPDEVSGSEDEIVDEVR